MAHQGKKYSEAKSKVDRTKRYELEEGVKLLLETHYTKFDEGVDLAIRLGVDPKKSDQMVRGTVVLPHGTGKKVRVAVFCKGESEQLARKAGADHVGAEDLINKVAGGFLDFDCAIATPDIMKDLARLGKVLGPRGLMPSTKTGTVTMDIVKAIEDVRRGKVEFRVDKQSGVHLSVGKISFDEYKLYENASRVIESLNEAKPASVKGKFIQSAFISSTMNPALKINL